MITGPDFFHVITLIDIISIVQHVPCFKINCANLFLWDLVDFSQFR